MKKIAAIIGLIVLGTLLLSGQRLQVINTNNTSAVSYIYYGPGCSTTQASCTTSGTNLGVTSVYQHGDAITTGSDASGYTVKACGIYNGATTFGSNFTMVCAIYAAGATTSPITNCAVTTSSAFLADTAWTENTNFSGCTLAASTSYYLFFQFSGANGASPAIVYNTGATRYYHSSTYGTWGSSLTWSTVANELFNGYVRVTAN